MRPEMRDIATTAIGTAASAARKVNAAPIGSSQNVAPISARIGRPTLRTIGQRSRLAWLKRPSGVSCGAAVTSIPVRP